jgi:formylglycine-generating enzyme required for sulfatase activity
MAQRQYARHREAPVKPTPIRRSSRIFIVLASAAVLGAGGLYLVSRPPKPEPLVASTTTPPPPPAVFGPTVVNDTPPPGATLDGMVWIPGGEFSMGEVGMKATLDARPIHRVYVDGFFMDKTDVTNAEFAKFVSATGYVTVAEHKPRAADFPGAPPENLVAGSVVFSAPEHPVHLDNYLRWWDYVPGTNWRHPLGPNSDIKGQDNYPVVHVAYEDAAAYAKWAGKQIPTEAQWEFAARGGLAGKPFTWETTYMGAAIVGWQTLTRGISLTRTRARMATQALLR